MRKFDPRISGCPRLPYPEVVEGGGGGGNLFGLGQRVFPTALEWNGLGVLDGQRGNERCPVVLLFDDMCNV